MKKFARVDGGVVAELLEAEQLPDFHPLLDWRDVTGIDGISERWVVIDGVEYQPPPPPSAEDQNAAILDQIDSIERQYLMNRGSREGWVALIEQQATAAGITEQQLLDPITGNRFYIKLRAVDDQIRALRSQLK